MIWNLLFIFILNICLVHSMEGYHHPSRGSSVWGYFTPPVLKWMPSQQPEQSPLEAMVDITNNLGVAILKDHSYSRGNFAFSPYGVASVLVVLYEGSRGESARQIHRAIGFPTDKDTIRVGFRDIHRHLRSYFSHEGYLSGITLNKECSSLKPEYKKILRFYGYDVELNQVLSEEDVDNENVTSEIAGNQTNVSESTTEASTSAKPLVEEKDPTTPKPPTSSTEPSKPPKNETYNLNLSFSSSTKDSEISNQNKTKPENPPTDREKDSDKSKQPNGETTSNPNREETKDKQNTTSETTEKMETSTLPITEKLDTTTNKPSETNEESEETPTTTETAQTDDEIQTETEKDIKTTEKPHEATTEPENATQETSTSSPLETTAIDTETKEPEINEESIKTNLDNGMLIPQPDREPTAGEEEVTGKDSPETDSTTAEMTSQFPAETTTETLPESSSRPEALKRGRALPLENGFEARNEISLKNSTKDYKFVGNIRKIVNSKVLRWLNEDQQIRRKRTITDYLKSPNNPDISLQLQNGMYDTHVSRNSDLYRSLPRLLFLVDGAVDTPVPMMTYTNVFPYGYIPRLHTKALEFPLDDIRYKLLILLPVERRGLRQLLYDLEDFPIRDILQTLRMTRVKAVIPTFMVEGFVILTSSLQKLGIWDVFDPRKANLSGMSTDPELYVRNVEQSVTVVIRNYVEILDIQTRTMAARQLEQQFEATHPFLYFVLDTATNVALMAGQMLDPLNSRIY